MTLPPEKIGDKGQRFQIKYSANVDAMDDERCLGYAGTQAGAEQMAEAWRKHPQRYFVWIVDRQAIVINETRDSTPGRSASETVKVERCDPPEGMGRLVPWCRVTTRGGITHEQFFPSYVETALGGDERGYFRAAWSSVVGWGISERVPAQDW